MKPRFTMFQKILTTLFVMLEGAVITGDVMELFWLHKENNDYYYWVNLVLCLFLLLVFLALIINPKAGVNADEADSPETLLPQLSASRTYMCFIAVDIAAIFAFVMFFSKFFKNPALIVIVGGIVLFVIGAIKYLYDCKKIGFEEIEYEDDDDDKKPADNAVKEQPKQEEKKPSEPKEEPKEQPKEEAKQEPTEEPKKEPTEEPKEEPTEEPKEQPKEEAKQEPTEEPKDEPKEEPKAETMDEVKAEEKPAEAPKKAPQQNKPAQKNTSVQKKSYPAKKKGGKKKKNKK